MATIAINKDGTLTVTLSPVEQDTFSGLPPDQLENYLTIWLKDRATTVFEERFAKLSPADQADIMLKIRQAG